ncbi:MAG TPA: hypothetical protein VNN12_01720 [Dehalococcoidia bacterium]|nr:hypothetical protein [Dehalococcoidia bacterium]
MRPLVTLGALAVAIALSLFLLRGRASANHGSDFIDLASTTGLSVTHNGAIFTQGGIGAGTGNFDPFLTYNPGGNANTEQGYNTTSPGQFDEHFGGGRTHPIQAAAIPSVDIGGTRYRVVLLDANDQGADDFMSIDTVKVFLDDQNNLHQYDNAANTFGTDNSSPATLVFDMDANCPGGDCVLLMRSQTFTPGSGVSDISIALPDSIFPPECFYGSQTCNKWFYLFTQMGGYVDNGTDPVSGTQNWNVTSGFEEWRTELVPVVNVTKTAVTSVTRNFNWTVDKKVKVDGDCVDTATVDLFLEESQTAEWCITATRDAGTITTPTLSGTITITNPTGGGVISASIPATITSIVDNVDFSNIPDLNGISLSCPFTLPFTLGAGQSVQCTYSVPATGANASTTGTNTVIVQVQNAGTDFVATDTFDFGTPDNVTDVNETATLTDTEGPLNQPAVSGQVVTYTRTYTCDEDEGTITNTATVTPNEGGTPASDSATLTVNCHELTVTKNASTSLTRTWNWTIDKSVTPDSWNLFTGESGTSEYTVTVTRTGFTDSAWAVAGQITVSNAGNPIPATINSVTDLVSGVGAATVNCGVTFPHVIAAGGSLTCSYQSALPDGSNRTNSATATQQLHDYNQNGVATADGTKTYSGSATVDFSSASITEVNPSVSVTDTFEGSLGTFSDTGSVSYTRSFECDGDEGNHSNTATITQTGQSDSASVTVNCYQLSVTKNAQTSFTRTYHWNIIKSSSDPNGHNLTLNVNEVYANYPYSVTVNVTGSTDSAWAVEGQITVSNADNPIPATINSVTDLVSGVGAATVNCGVTFPHVIPAGGQLVCTYSASLPDGNSRTNTATATQQLFNFDKNGTPTADGTADYSDSANVTFGSPTTVLDEQVSVSDTFAGNLGTCDVSSAPCTFTYDRDFGPFTAAQCGEHRIDNTATFVTNDTEASGDSSWFVVITVPCPVGCTLTQGYWKTHSIHGPAPADPTWDLLPSGPDTEFFHTGKTWYPVFWTAPKGGNANYILAHQYMAAVLNQLAGAASTPEVDAALSGAALYFEGVTNLGQKPSGSLRAQLIAWAGTLGAYNEGDIGPGHCSEDSLGLANNHD